MTPRFQPNWGLLFAAAFACAAHAGNIIYVDDDGPLDGDGSSWNTPYRFLQDALLAAATDDEIRVGGGTYVPDKSIATPDGTGSRLATFQLVDGVAILGGYAGFGAAEPDSRDLITYKTVLTGDLAGNDIPDEFPYGASHLENALHIVTGDYTGPGTMLDGVTITGGNTTAPSDGWGGAGIRLLFCEVTISHATIACNYAATSGGGIYSHESAVTIDHATIQGNIASYDGGAAQFSGGQVQISDVSFLANAANSYGAVYNSHLEASEFRACRFEENNTQYRAGAVYNTSSDVEFSDCTFRANVATDGAGAMTIPDDSHTTLIRCTFVMNQGDWGGAIANYKSSSPYMIGCFFGGNTAKRGGAILNDVDCHPVMINCIFSGNYSTSGGGAIHNFRSSNPTAIHCVFAENETPSVGGAIASVYTNSCVVVDGCIFWHNYAAQDPDIYNRCADATVRHSRITDGWPEGDNIAADPLFSDPDGADNIIGTEDDDYRLAAGSPCIDAGQSQLMPRDTHDVDGDGCLTERIPVDFMGNSRFHDDPNTPNTGTRTYWYACPDMGAIEFAAPTDQPDVPCFGDADCTDGVNAMDIDPFVIALVSSFEDPPFGSYYSAFPGCDPFSADCNEDGRVDLFDIDPFVAVLTGG